jgi:Icc-related predicted phosphoesterase
LCHCPPAGSRTAIARAERVDFGDLELAALCRAHRGPALALCGHVHLPWHWADRMGRTLALNPGYDLGAAWPAHHVIDLGRRRVEHRRAGAPALRIALGADGV